MILLIPALAMMLAPTPTADDLVRVFGTLKEAVEAKQGPAAITKLAAEVNEIAKIVLQSEEPEIEAEKVEWKKAMDYARSTQSYAEYSLFSLASTSEPPVAIQLFTALEQQNPKSQYLDQGYGQYFYALTQAGQAAKVTAAAQKALESFPENEDALAVLADNALNAKQLDSALKYSVRLISVLDDHPKPDYMSDADWQKKRTATLGRAYWIAGVIQSERNQHLDADRNLRAALPLIKGNNAMLQPALYSLGVANYQIARQTLNRKRMLEAADFSEQASKIQGPLQQNAWRNAAAMRDEATKMR